MKSLLRAAFLCLGHALAIGQGDAQNLTSSNRDIEWNPGKAEVRSVRGSAKYFRDEKWQPVKVGSVLRTGDRLKTDPESNVDLFLGNNGPVIRATQSTTLYLKALEFGNRGTNLVIRTELELLEGRILGHVNRLSSESRYEIKTFKGVAKLWEGDFEVSQNGMFVMVSKSGVFETSTNTYRVNAGEHFDPEKKVVAKAQPIAIGCPILPLGCSLGLPPYHFSVSVTGSTSSGNSHSYHSCQSYDIYDFR